MKSSIARRITCTDKQVHSRLQPKLSGETQCQLRRLISLRSSTSSMSPIAQSTKLRTASMRARLHQQADCTGPTLAEWLCRTADRIDPARVFGPHHCLGRGTSAPDSNFLCGLLQFRQNASVVAQGCADFSSDSTVRNHSLTPDPRRPSPLLRPGLSFRYTQGPRKIAEGRATRRGERPGVSSSHPGAFAKPSLNTNVTNSRRSEIEV
jgi:hypothetical protein